MSTVALKGSFVLKKYGIDLLDLGRLHCYFRFVEVFETSTT